MQKESFAMLDIAEPDPESRAIDGTALIVQRSGSTLLLRGHVLLGALLCRLLFSSEVIRGVEQRHM